MASKFGNLPPLHRQEIIIEAGGKIAGNSQSLADRPQAAGNAKPAGAKRPLRKSPTTAQRTAIPDGGGRRIVAALAEASIGGLPDLAVSHHHHVFSGSFL